MSLIIADSSKDFVPCPEGLHHAVCVDVVDLGMVETSFGQKDRVRIHWQIEEINEESGKRHTAVKTYTKSLNEKASLRRDLEAWRGRRFTSEELKGFDLEKLLGANAQIQVVHNLGDDGKRWANVSAIVPAPKGVAPLKPLDYVRKKDRDKAPETSGAPEDDDAVPF